MGAYTCQFGVVHKVCRCPTPHSISCDVPEKHSVLSSTEVSPQPIYEDKIDPPYYKEGVVEAIVITRELSYNVGNSIKYLWRLGKKNDPAEELKKARWYLKDEIVRLASNPGVNLFAQDKRFWLESFQNQVMNMQGNERLVLWNICTAVMNSDVEYLERAVKMLDLMIATEDTKKL